MAAFMCMAEGLGAMGMGPVQWDWIIANFSAAGSFEDMCQGSCNGLHLRYDGSIGWAFLLECVCRLSNAGNLAPH